MAREAADASCDAIVIGAGPAGGTAALTLARAGWDVALVEKYPFPRRKLCGEYLSATSLPVLAELGLEAAVRPHLGPEIRRTAVFARESEIAVPLPRSGNPAGSWGRSVSRATLDLLLLEAAVRGGARLWQPWSADALEPAPGGGWTCHLSGRAGTQHLSAQVVIVANGSWERGPVPVGEGASRSGADLLAFKGHFRGGALPEDLMPLLVFPGGYGGMVHSGLGGVNLSCCIRRAALQRSRRAPGTRAGEAVLAHVLAHCAGAARALCGARLDGAWLGAGPIRPGIRRAPAPGIFLAGNLAGEAHPIIAEGISMAIQSAWLLCRRLIARQDDLASAQALAEVGTAYAADWRRSFGGRLRAASLFAQVAMRPRAVGALLPVLGRFPALVGAGAALSGKATLLDAPR